ncbi:MAG TPA: hypothetical protein VFA75_00600 [Nevskia sp.]|jgi:hypothetical protein|nr:hypothetical protein [Nevskia sp.]
MSDPRDLSATAEPIPAARHALSKRQIRAATLANERLARLRWKDLLPDAKALWGKVPAEDLARVNGNIHLLAGLVQLRYRTNREDADRQVQQFFLDHPERIGTAAT